MGKLIKWYLIIAVSICGISFSAVSCQENIKNKELQEYRERLEMMFNPDIVDIDKNKQSSVIIIEDTYPDFDYSKNYPRSQSDPDIYCFGGVSVLDIYNDLKDGVWTHGYSNKFLYKDVYKSIIESNDAHTKAAFMTLIDYYYWYSVNYAAGREMITRGKYIDSNIDEVNGNMLMNDCVNRALDVMTAWQDYEVKMHIVDNNDGMDLGTEMNIGYWISLGDSKYLENTYDNMFTCISNEYYDIMAALLLELRGRLSTNYTYEVCGSPLDLILGYKGEYNGYLKEDLMHIDSNKLKKRFNNWIKKFEQDIAV